MNGIMGKEIIRGIFITMIPEEMKKYEDIPFHFVNELKTEFYSLCDTDHCDRSDLAGLNIDLKSESITFLLDISSSEIGLNEGGLTLSKTLMVFTLR
jgi:hypothetical protein